MRIGGVVRYTYNVEGVCDGDGVPEYVQLAGVSAPVPPLHLGDLQPVLTRQPEPTVLPHQHPKQQNGKFLLFSL